MSKKKNVILGDGITGYVIAACLNYNNETFKIYGNDSYKPPSILLLRCKNKGEIRHYFHIFEIEYNDKNIKRFVKEINVGYTNDFLKIIVDKPTEEMIDNYLEKQHREKTKSAMSDLKSKFLAINLYEVYFHLRDKYKKRHVKVNNVRNIMHAIKATTIYNTIFETSLNDYQPTYEYIVFEENEIGKYDYVYDCNKKSDIKRYTSKTIEFIKEPIEDCVTIENYYNEPRIYTINKPKSQTSWVDISRSATKTQLKQEDIINFLVKYE